VIDLVKYLDRLKSTGFRFCLLFVALDRTSGEAVIVRHEFADEPDIDQLKRALRTNFKRFQHDTLKWKRGELKREVQGNGNLR